MKATGAGLLTAMLLIAGLAVQSRGVVIRVPSEQPTIQEGIDAASEGDTVLVEAGTYAGPGNRALSFRGVDLVVTSESGPASTTIDCEGLDVAFAINQDESSASLIRGFTITNGSGGNGGGIMVQHAEPTIEDCVFVGNSAGSNGGGMWYSYTNGPGVVRDCVFAGNTAEYRGGAVLCDHASASISGCLFYGNTVTTESELSFYGGGAIHGNSSTVAVTNCTIARNAATTGAGGVYSYASSIAVERCIVAFSTDGPGVNAQTVSQCVIYGNAGGDSVLVGDRDNLYVDPRFCGMGEDDYTLCANSVCLPDSPENPWGQLVGALEQGCEDCESPAEGMSWGRIRSLFR